MLLFCYYNYNYNPFGTHFDACYFLANIFFWTPGLLTLQSDAAHPSTEELLNIVWISFVFCPVYPSFHTHVLSNIFFIPHPWHGIGNRVEPPFFLLAQSQCLDEVRSTLSEGNHKKKKKCFPQSSMPQQWALQKLQDNRVEVPHTPTNIFTFSVRFVSCTAVRTLARKKRYTAIPGGLSAPLARTGKVCYRKHHILGNVYWPRHRCTAIWPQTVRYLGP